mmetsp:Transcript_59931/g.123004  ORF Transcript_59931/g.123004 Transcript_59931/m.123004 type:complete len:162 (+) Transcript_59931:346-831(+)
MCADPSFPTISSSFPRRLRAPTLPPTEKRGSLLDRTVSPQPAHGSLFDEFFGGKVSSSTESHSDKEQTSDGALFDHFDVAKASCSIDKQCDYASSASPTKHEHLSHSQEADSFLFASHSDGGSDVDEELPIWIASDDFNVLRRSSLPPNVSAEGEVLLRAS